MYTKVRNFIVLLAILTVMTSSLTRAMPVLAQAKAIPQAVSGKTVKCPMPLPATEIEGKTIICGQIEVPENWDNLNTTCVEALRPVFVLPDATLPPVSTQ